MLSPLESEKPEQEATFCSKKKRIEWEHLVELFSSDLDKKITLASYKRERNKNKAAPCEANNYSICSPRVLCHVQVRKGLPLKNFSLRSQ